MRWPLSQSGTPLKLQDFNEIYAQMEKPAFVFDGRKILDYNQLQSIGFTAYEIGKANEN